MKLVAKKILKPRNPLRRVDQACEEYHALRESISFEGLLQPISVFKLDNGEYELIDGGHRLQAHIDLGIKLVECIIRDILPENSLRQQIIHNAHRIELNPVDIARAIKDLLKEKDLSQRSLANELRISRSWISRNIFIADCDNKMIIRAVNRAQLKLASAKTLMKLPKSFWEAFLVYAIEYKQKEFEDMVSDLVRKDFADCQTALDYIGIKNKVAKRYRGDSFVLSEIRTSEAYNELKKRKEFVDIESAWKVALKWCVQQDELGSVGLAEKKSAENRRKNFKNK